MALGVLLVAACTERADGPAAVTKPLRTAADSAEADATVLGREIYRVLDLAADYRGSHRGRPPASIRALGVDSLTPAMARGLATVGSEVRVTVSFRDPGPRYYASCTGELKVLEDAVLGAGRYTLDCSTPSGDVHSVQAGGALE